MKANLMQLSEYTWERTRARLEGLTDDEYLWEPVAGCWTIRPSSDGLLHPDWQFPVEPPPFTNIAWRISHLINCYGAKRNRQWLGLPSPGETDQFEPSAPAPASAKEAVTILEEAYSEWASVMGLLSEVSLADKLGPVAGPYAEADKAGFVLHMIDEFIHHGAEVALLRDLWRVHSSSGLGPS